jgi:DNA-binding PadR family transcriptional regulator
MTKPPKAGFAGSFRAPLGPYQVQVMRAIETLGVDAYGGRIETHLIEAGYKSNRGEVYGATTRMAERGFLDESTAPHPTRGGRYTVTVYTLTKKGQEALTVSQRMYDGTHFVVPKKK